MHQEFEVPEALQDAIKCFWYERRNFGEQPVGYEVLPDGYAEVIFYFGSCSIAAAEGLQPLPSPFMIGLLNQPIVFYSQNQLEIIGIRCFPWAVFDLFGLSPGKDGVRVFDHPIARLQLALNNWIQAGSLNKAITTVEQFCLNMRSEVATNSMLHKAGVAMRASNGNLPVSAVAAAAHATLRTLERNFKQSSGYTVKDVSAVMRFEQVRNRLLLNPDTQIGGLAYELGYTDQAHLSKEFKRYSGTTPAAFARQLRKAQQ